MKKIIFFITCLLAVSVFAKGSNLSIEQKIINKIAYALYPKKEVITVYFYGDKLPLYLKTDSHIKITDNANKADIIIIGKIGYKAKKTLNKLLIVLDYSLLNKYPTAIGAYYWQKSRPNIVMLESRLQKMHIVLPKEFERYIESNIW